MHEYVGTNNKNLTVKIRVYIIITKY
jgi:hypothetical protein